MLRAALLALCVAACGDNLLPDGVPLAQTEELVLVAHQDDDLLFMQPDVADAVRSDRGVTSVYVTAGNGTKGADKAQRRYEGLMFAYAEAAGSGDWQCGWIDLLGHPAEHCRLSDHNVSLVFLGYPDGGKLGEIDGSLLQLWEGKIASATTVATHTAEYGRFALIDTVAQIVRETQPARVRTLEVASTHGRDHSDHMIVGALSVLAIAKANSRAQLISYRGYSIADEPANMVDAIYEDMFDILARYEACATDCAACGDSCPVIDSTHTNWLRRRYAVGFRPAAGGQLRSGNECVTLDARLGSCGDAPAWRLDNAGQLRSGDRCLGVEPDGNVVPSPCLGGVERRFFVDDEGHIWSAMPPAPEDAMDYAHLWCLTPRDGVVRAELCGADRAPTWELAPTAIETDRSVLMLTALGREVRLGDLTGDGKGDLCAIQQDSLVCAAGDGAGGFLPVVRLDEPTMPLSIDPRSLTLGDVDGDGALDACGRNATGVLCATAATGFTAEKWSPSFNDTVARATTSASLAAVDANADGVADLCGVDITGVVCVPRGFALQPLVRSAWPSPMAVVWPADLDGDHQADWCAATDTGPACAVEAQRDLTTDGAPWGFSLGGVVDVAPSTTTTVAIADIDGDGRADLCAPRDDRIVCARSQGRGFGPRETTLAILPNQAVASALWLGDLDGDGRADACADTGTAIACAVSP